MPVRRALLPSSLLALGAVLEFGGVFRIALGVAPFAGAGSYA